jgi:hypothetical protein
MSSEGARHARLQVYADLVAGLLDARDDVATARFDAELEHAVATGAITAGSARRQRFRQRASIRGLADHTKSVLPTALSALDASRAEAEAALTALADTLDADPQVAGPAKRPGGEQHRRSGETRAGAAEDATAGPPVGTADDGTSGPTDGVVDVLTGDPTPDATDIPAADDATDDLVDMTVDDTPGAASETAGPEASSLDQGRHRLIVADLVTVSHVRPDRRAPAPD